MSPTSYQTAPPRGGPVRLSGLLLQLLPGRLVRLAEGGSDLPVGAHPLVPRGDDRSPPSGRDAEVLGRVRVVLTRRDAGLREARLDERPLLDGDALDRLGALGRRSEVERLECFRVHR